MAPQASGGAGASGRPVKVLYIAGWGRSGTTLLANLAGQLQGYCSVGELAYLWRPAGLPTGLCGCGQRIRECPFWSAVLDSAFGPAGPPEPASIFRLEREHLRTWNLPGLWMAVRRGQLGPPVSSYASILERLYQAIASLADARVVVDSSKQPPFALVASTLPGVELSIVHMVRDPRAVAFSWSRPKPSPGRASGKMERYGPLYSSNRWTGWNLAIEALRGRAEGRYHLLRYEDLARDPRQALEKVMALVDEPRALPFLTDAGAVLAATHTASGNPNRFTHGPVAIRPDTAWRQQMPVGLGWSSTIPALPLLARYGYRLNWRS